MMGETSGKGESGSLEEGTAELRPKREKNEGKGAQAKGAAWTRAPR